MYEDDVIDQDRDFLANRSAEPGRSYTRDTPIDRIPEHQPKARKPAQANILQSEKVQELWKRMMGHYLHELEIQSANRAEMAEDEAFYDGDQWSDTDAQLLRDRGQEPIVYNVICTALNWVFGTERRTRTDYKVLPRREEGAKPAERKSEIMKYIADVNRAEFGVSRAFQDATRAGVGWLEGGLQDENEGEPIFDRSERWRNMVWDSTATEDDMSDARYIFRHKWVDRDMAQAYFPGREETFEHASTDVHNVGGTIDDYGDWAMDAQEEYATNDSFYSPHFARSDRHRLRLIEAWFRKPERAARMAGGDFSGEIFDPASPGHQSDLLENRAQIRESVVMRVYVMIFTTAGPVYFGKSPYRHNRFPFTPIWGFRRGDNGQPYGLVRNLKGMQRDVNKRASKALAIMSSNRTIMEEGAVDDLDEFEEEVARPDAIIVKRSGKALDIDADRGMEGPHLDLMSRTIAMIQSTSGITDENLGRETNANSGKAIIARQDQGSLATSILFDNLRLARQIHGEKQLSLIEQFMTKEKRFRITNKRGTPSYPAINDGLPENDIVRTKADFIISEDSWDASLRQAKSAELQEMLKEVGPVAPQVVMVVLDLLFETMDLPNGDEIVKRVRQVTGMIDPDADLNNPDPDTAQLLEAQKAQQELAQRKETAELSKTEAEAAEKGAKAEKTAHEAAKLLEEMPGANLEQKKQALELAVEMMNARPAVSVADRLLAEAGVSFTPPAGGPAAPQGGPPEGPPPVQPEPPAPPPGAPMPA